MKKIFALILLFFVLITCSYVEAKSVKKDLSDVIKEFGVDENSLAVSFKNLDTGKVFFR